MPRVSGIYSRPTGIDAVANNTIDSGKYNSNVADVEADLNLPRPIVAGGTGATSALDARANLHAEASGQPVTDYNSVVFENGSFYSLPGATGAPVAGHNISGIAYGFGADNLILEARVMDDVTVSGAAYVRKKMAGVWGPWAYGLSVEGPITIAPVDAGTWPTIYLNCNNGSTSAAIFGQLTGLNRWMLMLGSTGTRDFMIARYNDAGSQIDFPLIISRTDGHITIKPEYPVDAWHIAPKQYVDDKVATKLTKAGDTMTGKLNVQISGGPLPVDTAAIAVGYVTAGSAGISLKANADGVYPLAFYNAANALVGNVFTSATTTTYSTSSDGTLKEDLKSFDAGNIIDDTNVYDFAWKSTKERAFGVIAQQAKDVYPAAFTQKDDRWFVDYSKYCPVMLQELQSLRTRAKDLETKLASAMSRLDVLDKFREKIEAL